VSNRPETTLLRHEQRKAGVGRALIAKIAVQPPIYETSTHLRGQIRALKCIPFPVMDAPLLERILRDSVGEFGAIRIRYSDPG
jgi:hypothetical protein